MENKNQAAFPSAASEEDYLQSGCTKREYFAITALNGLLSNGFALSSELTARKAIELADELLIQLEKQPQP